MIKRIQFFKYFSLSFFMPLTLGAIGQGIIIPSFSCKGIFEGEGVCRDCRKIFKKITKSKNLSTVFINRCKKRSLEEKKDTADLEDLSKTFKKNIDPIKKKLQNLNKSLEECRSSYENTSLAFEENMIQKSQYFDEHTLYKPFFKILDIEKKYFSTILLLAIQCNFYESFPDTLEHNKYVKKKQTLEYLILWHKIILETKEILKLKFSPKLHLIKQKFNKIENYFKKYSQKLEDIIATKESLLLDCRKKIYSRILEEIIDKYVFNTKILFLQDQVKNYLQEQRILKKRKKVVGKLASLFQRHRSFLQDALSSPSFPKDDYKRFKIILKKLVNLKNKKEALTSLMGYGEDYKLLAHKQLFFLSSLLQDSSDLVYSFPMNVRRKKDVVRLFKIYVGEILKEKVNHDNSYVHYMDLKESLLNDYRLYFKEIQNFFPQPSMDFFLLHQKRITLYDSDHTMIKGYSFLEESSEDSRLSFYDSSESEEKNTLNHNQEQEEKIINKPFEIFEELEDFFLQDDLLFYNTSDIGEKDNKEPWKNVSNADESMKENSLDSEKKVRGREEESQERRGEEEDCAERESSEEEDNFLNDDSYSFLFFRNN